MSVSPHCMTLYRWPYYEIVSLYYIKLTLYIFINMRFLSMNKLVRQISVFSSCIFSSCILCSILVIAIQFLHYISDARIFMEWSAWRSSPINWYDNVRFRDDGNHLGWKLCGIMLKDGKNIWWKLRGNSERTDFIWVDGSGTTAVYVEMFGKIETLIFENLISIVKMQLRYALNKTNILWIKSFELNFVVDFQSVFSSK